MVLTSATVKALIEIGRPKQWVKNAFVFAPLIFAKKINEPLLIAKALAAFILFCFLSSCVYTINDIADLERDRSHPDKRNRPLPSGRLTIRTAMWVYSVLFLGSIVGSAFLSLRFFAIAWIYIFTNLLYSYWWRSAVILDGMIIALGFVLRTYAGAVVINAVFSDWLYICATFVSLFLAFSKRRHEIILLGDEIAQNHRAILREYSTQLLDQIIAIVTAATAVSYSLYCIDISHPTPGDPSRMKFTMPFVLYGLFRYLYLVYRKEEGGNPTEVLLADRPLLLNGLLWLAVVFWALYPSR